jgi:hypothetical protein
MRLISLVNYAIFFRNHVISSLRVQRVYVLCFPDYLLNHVSEQSIRTLAKMRELILVAPKWRCGRR